MNNKGDVFIFVLIIGMVLALLAGLFSFVPYFKTQTTFNKMLSDVASPNDWCEDVVKKLNELQADTVLKDEAKSKFKDKYEYVFTLVRDKNLCEVDAEAKSVDILDSDFETTKKAKSEQVIWKDYFGTKSTQDTAKTGLLCCIYLQKKLTK